MSQIKQLDALPSDKCTDMQYILDNWTDEDDTVSDNINRLKEEFWTFYSSKYSDYFAVTPVASSIGVIPCGTEKGVHIGLRFSARGEDRYDFYSADVDKDTDFQVFVNLKTGEAFLLYLNGGGSDGCIQMMDVLDIDWFMLPVMFGMRGGMQLGEEDDDE
jgi:hypothetical protein